MILSKSVASERADIITKFVNVGKVRPTFMPMAYTDSKKLMSYGSESSEAVQLQHPDGCYWWCDT
jgi:hypothetical protein